MENLRQGRLFGRFFAASRKRLREVAGLLGVRYGYSCYSWLAGQIRMFHGALRSQTLFLVFDRSDRRETLIPTTSAEAAKDG
jgi:hypothetical protein